MAMEEKKVVEHWIRYENGKAIGHIYVLDDGSQIIDGE
jgi:hypothetical protein